MAATSLMVGTCACDATRPWHRGGSSVGVDGPVAACRCQNPARQRFFLGAATRFLAAFVTFVLAMLAGFFTVGFFVGASFRLIATRFSFDGPTALTTACCTVF